MTRQLTLETMNGGLSRGVFGKLMPEVLLRYYIFGGWEPAEDIATIEEPPDL